MLIGHLKLRRCAKTVVSASFFKERADEWEVHLQQAVAVDQQVARFDVPVQDPSGVQVLQP